MPKDIKIGISPTANKTLEAILDQAKDGYLEGKITKASLLNWIIAEFAERHFEKAIPRIREEHKDEIRILEAKLQELKKAKRSSQGGNG